MIESFREVQNYNQSLFDCHLELPFDSSAHVLFCRLSSVWTKLQYYNRVLGNDFFKLVFRYDQLVGNL